MKKYRFTDPCKKCLVASKCNKKTQKFHLTDRIAFPEQLCEEKIKHRRFTIKKNKCIDNSVLGGIIVGMFFIEMFDRIFRTEFVVRRPK